MAIMLTTTAVVIVDVLVRLGDETVARLVALLSVVVDALVTWGAAYGGALVYDYGFNLETSGAHPVWHESETDVYPGHD